MFSSIDFWLATTAIAIAIACYIVLLVKFKQAKETPDLPDFSELLEETDENLSIARREELLEKYKEERIKEYLEKKQKSESS